MREFNNLFSINKPIIGMIHLAGNTPKEKLNRALKELTIYEKEGVDGAIIENFYGNNEDVARVLEASEKRFDIIKGVNILKNPYSAFILANLYHAEFVQFDSVQTCDLDLNKYNQLREKYPHITVLGGVGFKYIPPTGNPLEEDLREAKQRCEAIVTTVQGTGIETPLEKLIEYKRILQDFTLISGAGVNLENIAAQLTIADGAIIGTGFKPNKDTQRPVYWAKVRDIMDIVKMLRD